MQVILKNGCIDNNMDLVVNDYRKKNKKIFDYVFKLDNYLNKLEKNLKKENPKDYDVYIIITFVQIHNSFQSFIALLERGMYDDSQIILRSLYDKMIKCLYVIHNNSNFEIIKQDDTDQTIKLFNFVVNHKDFFKEDIVNKYNVTLNELKKNIKHDEKGKRIKLKSNEKLCKEIGNQELYFVYKFLCGYTHNQLFVPGKKLRINKNVINVIQYIEYPEDLYYEISLIIQSLSYIIIPLCKYISNKNLEEEFNKLFNSFEDLKSK